MIENFFKKFFIKFCRLLNYEIIDASAPKKEERNSNNVSKFSVG